MNSSLSLFEHPIIFKQVSEYLVFSCPDLQLTWSTSVPRTKNDLLEAQITFLSKVKARKKQYLESKIKMPSPSKIQIAEKKHEKEVLLSVREAAQRLGFSVRKIQKDVSKGLLKSVTTSGGAKRKGNNKFTLPALLAYKALLHEMQNDKNWLTPMEYARSKNISVNTARNWADSGKVVSKKSRGGHRLILAL